MSDNEDGQSEVAPEGWAAVFNQMNLGSPVASTVPKKKPKNEPDPPPATSWLGGWFGSPVVAPDQKSSISSDSPSKQSSKHSSQDMDDADDREFLKDEDSPTMSEGDSNVDLDSDGFPKGGGSPKDSGVNSSISGSEASSVSETSSVPGNVDGVVSAQTNFLPAPTRTDSRRDRILNRQQFVVSQTAAELVEPEGAPESIPMVGVADVPAETSWWQTVFPAAKVETTPADSTVGNSNPIPVEEPAKVVADPVPLVESSPSVWEKVFGPASPEPPSAAEQARRLLPDITLPPSIDALRDINSYFPVPGLAHQIDILGPGRSFGRFQGKVRGWPRQVAPYWSSERDGASSTRPPGTFNPSISGASALAMFRVT